MEELFKSPKDKMKDYRIALHRAIDALEFIDYLQKRWKWTRQERRKWWRSFISSPKFRELELNKIKKDFDIG